MTSKKSISSLGHSKVNLVVGWEALNVSIKCFKESFPFFQIKKISSLYLHDMRGYSWMSCKFFSLRSAVDRTAYGGKNLVPTGVHLNCFKVLSLNWKTLFFKATSASSTKVSVVTFLCALASKNIQSETRPSSCGILG